MTSDRVSNELLVDFIWQELCEMSDRSSPEDFPDMALVNRDDLIGIIGKWTELQPLRASETVSNAMTPEEMRLEDLKQMAAYSGPIVSFEFREPFYLASCDRCGWVGSSELCGTDSWGDDSDVYCPRCHASGADCGKIAAALPEPVQEMQELPAPTHPGGDNRVVAWRSTTGGVSLSSEPFPTAHALVTLSSLETAERGRDSAQKEIEAAKNDLRSFMTTFVREHFPDVPQWKPLPDLLGMLSQMDNASTVARDLSRRAETAEASLAAAREALGPFARAEEEYPLFREDKEYADGHEFLIGHLRAARAALAGSNGNGQ